MDGTDRQLTADDIVGILIHRANQMASYLSVHGTQTDWAAMIQHLGGMYQDVVRAKEIMEGVLAPSNGHATDAHPN